MRQDLKELTERIGFSKAVAELRSSLPSSFWGKLSISQLIQIQIAVPSGKFKQELLERIVSTAKTFDELVDLYFKVSRTPTIKKAIIAKLRGYKDTFRKWHEVFEMCKQRGSFRSSLWDLSFDKMYSEAKTFQQWRTVTTYNGRLTIYRPDLETYKNLVEKAESLDDWLYVLEQSGPSIIPRRLREMARKKVCKKARSLDDWLKIYEVCVQKHHDDILRKLVVSNVEELATDSEDWEYIHERLWKGTILSNIALRRITGSFQEAI